MTIRPRARTTAPAPRRIPTRRAANRRIRFRTSRTAMPPRAARPAVLSAEKFWVARWTAPHAGLSCGLFERTLLARNLQLAPRFLQNHARQRKQQDRRFGNEQPGALEGWAVHRDADQPHDNCSEHHNGHKLNSGGLPALGEQTRKSEDGHCERERAEADASNRG